MKLTKHSTPAGPRWAADNYLLPTSLDLQRLLELPRSEIQTILQRELTTERAHGSLLAPIDSMQEVWASGVTYQRSREARRAESDTGDIYDHVYVAERPELFFKAAGWRVTAHQGPVRIRADSAWNVPEPELTLVINRFGEIVGYTAGNDMSSRSIEGENPLYLPQAKMYNGSCALGPEIYLSGAEELRDLPIMITVERVGQTIFRGETRTAKMNRKFDELVKFLFRELSFPYGAFLMTGTGIVPPDQFTLALDDKISIGVGEVTLENYVGK